MRPVTGHPYTIEHFEKWARRLVLDTGDRWPIADWQLEIVEDILNGIPEVWVVIPQGNAKAVCTKTPLATPFGWTTMGDVEPGDYLLGSDGNPVEVKHVSPVMMDRPCYEVKFSDGASIIADAEHLWTVDRHDYGYEGYGKNRTYTTQQMVDIGVCEPSGIRRFRVATATRQGTRSDELTVDPYTLGVWLGDGDLMSGGITNADDCVWDRIASVYKLGKRNNENVCRRHTVLSLVGRLKKLGVLGNKHIPAEYLVASVDQRRALIQGLLDSDGSVNKAGQVTFAVTDRALAEDFRKLAWSLGRPCSWTSYPVPTGRVHRQTCYRLVVSCDARHDLFFIPRKSERLRGKQLTTEHRRIVSIESVTSRPVKCVQVEAEDSLYLAGEAMIPTHNTTLMAAVALYHTDFVPSPWVPLGAASREQAEILFSQAKGFVENTPGMSERFRVYDGYRKIVLQPTDDRPATGRGIKVYAADEKTGDGVIPSLSFVDEGHRHKNLALYRLWRGKMRKRTINRVWRGQSMLKSMDTNHENTLPIEPRKGTIVMTSTAGEPGADFETTRAALRNQADNRVRRGPCYLRAEGPQHVLHEYSVPSPGQCRDLDMVKAANPLMTISVQDLADLLESPTLDWGEDWLRLTCNIPARSTKAAISEVQWDEAFVQDGLPERVPVSVGADFAWIHDCTALVPLWIRDVEYRMLGDAEILTPPGNGDMLDPQDVHDAFMRIHERNPISMVVMDMTKAQETAAWLMTEIGCRVVDSTQANTHAALDYESFTEGLREGWIHHTGDNGLRAHIMNAIARKLPSDKYRFDRPTPSRAQAYQDQRVIDGLQAAAMVHRTAVADLLHVAPMPLVAVVSR